MHCLKPLIRVEGQLKDIKSVFTKNTDNFNSRYYRNFGHLVPCTQCLNCRILKSREWSARLGAESKCWPYTYFLTLTYNDENIPDVEVDKHYLTGEKCVKVPTLNTEDVKKFIQRYRYNVDKDCTYFYSGEYGTKTHRPHYHLILFTKAKLDIHKIEKDWEIASDGVCDLLSDMWNLGNVRVAIANGQRLKYVAQYTQKKYATKNDGFDYGERKVEFTSMSKKIPLGYKYFQQKKKEILKTDRLISIDVPVVSIPNSFLKYGLKVGDLTYKEVEKIKARRLIKVYQFYKKNPKFLSDVIAQSMQLERKQKDKQKAYKL